VRQISSNQQLRRRSTSLYISTIDIEVASTSNSSINNISKSKDDDGVLQWKDIIPISLFTTLCIAVAILVSTYEDYDVTHTRPSPSSLRLPTTFSSTSRYNFIGAATKGMGSGAANRGVKDTNDHQTSSSTPSFEEWYGTSATTLQFKPSYNEIMLQHRTERIPRWNNNDIADTTKEELQQAVLQLYKSIDELDELKLMADDYNWDGIKEYLNPVANTLDAAVDNGRSAYVLPTTLEYSMDILKTMPSYYTTNGASNGNSIEVSELIGLDWGSCAWRHCGAKADAQEAIAELYNNVGMLEPFECRFIIDVVERSIRDVLVVIPDDIKPNNQQVKPYVEYIPQAQDDSGELGIDFEYANSRELARNAFDD